MSLPTIPPSGPSRLRLTDVGAEQTGTTARTSAGPAPASGPAPADEVMLSDSAALSMGETLAAKNPPFDLETVSRIKQAIAEGRYPIDTQAISESLFAGFSELIL